jgi:2-keto-4-pentenoate hydratase/2-oxohepta-3-ene-1,7-dioic acid hydratase in catechol pathway
LFTVRLLAIAIEPTNAKMDRAINVFFMGINYRLHYKETKNRARCFIFTKQRVRPYLL